MSSTQAHHKLLPSLTPELRPAVIDQTELILLKIIRANLNTQYASKTPLLAEFRDAVSARGSTSACDTELVHDFRHAVPLSDYDAYKPFMAAFNACPCKEAELENLFAPGLPYFLAISSATSGKEPKILPRYNSRPLFAPSEDGLVAGVFFYGYRELKYVEREPGQIVKTIPVSNASSGIRRAALGWTNVDEDEDRMHVIAPGLVAPFAASMITHNKSFLMIHALFTLARGDIDFLVLTFSTLFYDLVRYIDEDWDLFLSSIKNGTVPDLPGVGKLHSHLQVNFHANPVRAAELCEIGPPSSCEGWAARVWPKLKRIRFGCSGPFANVLPQWELGLGPGTSGVPLGSAKGPGAVAGGPVKSIIGPTITIRTNYYTSSEAVIGAPYRPDDDLHTFVLQSGDLVEFLDVTAEESHQSLLQAWELETGKQYEVVLTTRDGLWRYRLGDVIEVVGFHANNGFPVFVLSGRRNLEIRLAPVLISDSDIISAIQAISSDIIQVDEFTTLHDDRQSTPTVGYLIELAGVPGPNAHLAPQRLSEGLAAANTEFQVVLEDAEIRIPSVRILKPGTFAAFRQWKAEKMSIGPGQVKVPAVLVDEASRKWILENVVEEL